MDYAVCSGQTVDILKCHILQCVKLIHTYRWLIDAYISDFFTHDHWSQLPETWRYYLEDLQPPELSFILSSHQPHTGKVPPLSLLALHKCTNVLSLIRQKVNLYEDDVTKNLFSKKCDKARTAVSHHTNTNITTPTSAKEDIKDGQYLPLDSCFRKHVKPKKQHEILQLGRAIQLVSKRSHCGNVVDIGAGQGHLSRLLALGHGFKVTTVEAAGCHAPKAVKFDKDAQHDLDRANLKRKLSRPNIKDGIGVSSQSADTAMEFAETGNVTLPEHLTCVIQPDTSVDEFLKIVQNSLKRVQQPYCVMLDRELNFEQTLGQDEKQNTEERSGSNSLCVATDSLTTGHCVKDKIVTECAKSFNTENFKHITTDRHRKGTVGDLPQTQSPDSEYKVFTEDEKSRSHQFIMTGLHACGDLTTTMIRVYVGCEDIVGLASVACCYMKLTCKQGSGKSSQCVGYPMSDFVADLPDSFLSYEAREMACHFCDSYRERLIANPPNLKLHCYRAMLQCIIRMKDPGYCHGCVKLNVRHAERLTFEQYAKMGLKRLGMEDSIPRDLLQEVESYLPFWKNVVSFYTLRLSLAPVVETLILLDRMIYLYEKGLCSSLVPIFDPLLSPRNFVLVSVK